MVKTEVNTLNVNNSHIRPTSKSKRENTTVEKEFTNTQSNTKLTALVDLPQHKIENIKEFTEDSEIKNIRDEKERDLRRKDEEIILKQKIEKEKQIELKMEINKTKKEIDGKKLTFDVNGNPVSIKTVALEKLALDFAWAR